MPWGGHDQGPPSWCRNCKPLNPPDSGTPGQNQGVVDGSKETNWHSLFAENSVLFGGFAEDFGPVDRLSDRSEDLLRGAREEPGHIGVFVMKTRQSVHQKFALS